MTVPSCYYILQHSPDTAHGHDAHGDSHRKDDHAKEETEEAKTESEDSSEGETEPEASASEDEAKEADTPETSDDESKDDDKEDSEQGGAVESAEKDEPKDKVCEVCTLQRSGILIWQSLLPPKRLAAMQKNRLAPSIQRKPTSQKQLRRREALRSYELTRIYR